MTPDETNQPKDRHSKRTRTQITIKVFTKKKLTHISQGNARLKESVILGLVSDIFKDYELIALASFKLEEDEAVFDLDRMNERKTHGNRGANVRVPADSKIVFQELSEKSGIPIWKIVDHGLRLFIKYEYFSGKGTKWKRRIRDALKGRVKPNLKKIHVLEAEPIEEIPAVVERTVTPLKTVARNRVYPLLKFEPIQIRLELKIKDIPGSIRRALDNFYRWTPFNADEASSFLNLIEENRNPVNLEVIKKNVVNIRDRNYLVDTHLYKYKSEFTHDKKQVSIDLYKLLGIEWSCPPWIEKMRELIDFFNLSKNYREIKKMYFSNRMWFEKYEVDIPDTYRGHEDEICITAERLKRLGIAESMDLRIKELLKIEDEFEYALNHYEELDEWEKKQIESKIRWEFKDHEYAQLLREKFKRDEERAIIDLPPSR